VGRHHQHRLSRRVRLVTGIRAPPRTHAEGRGGGGLTIIRVDDILFDSVRLIVIIGVYIRARGHDVIPFS